MNWFDDIWTSLAQWCRESSLSLLRVVIELINNAPEPNLANQGSWFTGQYSTVFLLALYAILPFAMLATIAAILKGGLSELIKTFLIGIPVAIFGSVAALAIITIMQNINTNLVDALLGKLNEDYTAYFNSIDNAPVPGADQLGALLLQCLIFALMALFAIAMYLEMIFRTVAIYLAVLVLPLGFASYIWRPSRKWFGRLAEMVAVLIFSKLVIVAVLAMGMSILRFAFPENGAGPFDQAGQTGALVAGMVCFFAGAVAGPAIVGMVLSPNFEHRAMDRKTFGHMTPLSGDNRGTISTYRGIYGNLGRRLTGQPNQG